MDDWNVIDMPTMLSREVLRQDIADPTVWVRDDKWYEDILGIYGGLLEFLRAERLVVGTVPDQPIEQIVLRLSDLVPLGQELERSGAIEHWLASFDRPGRRKGFRDVRPLKAALRRLQSMG